MLVSRPLQGLEMGDDAAAAQGINTEPAKLWLLVVGVCLTAICTAAAGPIAFVALAAPQIARRRPEAGGCPCFPLASSEPFCCWPAT